MRFVIVGDGFPIVRIIEILTSFGQVSNCMLFTTPQENGKTKAEQVAEQASIPVYPSEFLKGKEGIELIKKEKFDWLVNINSSVIFSNEVLGLPKHGAINMHPGLLPEYAGLHTHQWAIRNGEKEFGATIHFIEEKLDVGDIISLVLIPIEDNDTGLSLFMKCIKAGTEGMREVIRKIKDGEPLTRIKQDLSKYHLYRHRDALNGKVNWEQKAGQIERFIRAGSYYPFESPTYKPYFELGDYRYEILKAEISQSVDNLKPGHFLWRANQLIVGCGNDTHLKILQIHDLEMGRKLTQDEMAELLTDGIILGVDQ